MARAPESHTAATVWLSEPHYSDSDSTATHLQLQVYFNFNITCKSAMMRWCGMPKNHLVFGRPGPDASKSISGQTMARGECLEKTGVVYGATAAGDVEVDFCF